MSDFVYTPDENIMSPAQYAAVRHWRDSNGGTKIRLAADAGKILEEVLELCYASGMYVAEVDNIVARETYKALNRSEVNGHYSAEKCGEEAADTAVTLASFVQKAGLNMTLEVGKVLSKIRNRAWLPDEFGVLRRPNK